DAEVAQAIDEHYMPRFAGDAEPKTVAGRIVSLADKIDNIVATFSRGLIPTGSQDPFALRRQALGLVRMLIDEKISVKLSDIVEKSMDQFKLEGDARQKMQQDVADFIRLRLKNVFEEENIPYDVADAVLSDTDDVYAVFCRAQAVSKELSSQDLTTVIQAFVRAGNIAKKADSTKIDEAFFENDAEKALYQAFTSAEGSVESLIEGQDYVGAIDALKDLAQPIDSFFDAVMVMAEDEKVRNNRLGLLKSINDLICKVADFSKIVLKK
ncbi:MAG: glycine--tRNA ligase subunit beta, partial [Schwartzia sp.]|nr:glycine--tRNA ligase subunit beta [Schwartzia sp. (in: firmicutes)]